MQRRNIRSVSGSTTRDATTVGLLRKVGQALGARIMAPNVKHSIEALEQRAMLEGSFAAPLPLPAPGAGGIIVQAGNINPALPSTNNDTYLFTATTPAFVTVLADTANETSNLDTQVSVFNSAQTLIASGVNNGTLTTGLQRDGWAGFVAQAGQSYFIRVASEGSASGTYTLRIHTTNEKFDIGGDLPVETGIARESGSDIPNAGPPPILPTAILGQLGGLDPVIANRIRQDEVIYRFDVPTASKWNSLVTVNAQSTVADPSLRTDTRLEIYNATGQLIASDSDAGRLNDAFTTFVATAGGTFYIRVRSDEVRGTNPNTATGPFFLVLDALPNIVTLDRVSRRGGLSDAMDAFQPPSTPPNPNMPTAVFQTKLYKFQALGNLRTFITAVPTGLSPVFDPALRIFDAAGQLILFNNNFAGLAAQLQVTLQGGQDYFVVVDSFAQGNGVQFQLWLESSHQVPTLAGVDDHINTATFTSNPPSRAEREAARLRNELATELQWNGPFITPQNVNDVRFAGLTPPITPRQALDNNIRILRDRGLTVQATGTGRLDSPGDVDLFQFVAPIDMQSVYNGNNNDAGSSLYIGGRFQAGDPTAPFPTNSRGLTVWDAADYWAVGGQQRYRAFDVTLGFNDNPATASTTTAEIYAMYTWPQPNNRPPILVVGGDFTLVAYNPVNDALNPSGAQRPPIVMNNLATMEFIGGNWVWTNRLGAGTDGPVHAIIEYDPVGFDPDGSGPGDPEPDPGPIALYIGGSFTEVDGTPAESLARFTSDTNVWEGSAGLGGPVFAFELFDPADPGNARAEVNNPPDPPIPAVADVPDQPITLYIGGDFGLEGGLIAFNGVAFVPAAAGEPQPSGFVNGTVYALERFLLPDPDGDGPRAEQLVLAVGGDFTSAGGIPATNFAIFGILDPGAPNQDPEDPVYQPQLFWDAPIPGLDGAVRAMTNYNPPDTVPTGAPIPNQLVLGGDFLDPESGLAGVLAWDGFGAGFLGGVGKVVGNTAVPGSVRALTAFVDAEEPLVENLLDGENVQQALYIGGDFQFAQVGPDPLSRVFSTAVIQFSAITGTGPADDDFAFVSLNRGVGNLPNATPTPPTPTVFALHNFDDGNPQVWDRHDRPATRLSITNSPVEASFVNTRIRVLDSNFRVVYDFDRLGSDTIAGGFPDPSGMLDPALVEPPGAGELSGITLWGGETYYIEVSDLTNSGTGRYSFTVTADAGPFDVNGDGALDDVNALSAREEANNNQPPRAFNLNPSLFTGDATTLRNTNLPLPGAPISNSNESRVMRDRPSVGTWRMGSDQGNISSIDDTDLFIFRAEFTGTAEIRISTVAIPDRFGELLGTTYRGITRSDAAGGSGAVIGVSNLDAALRIFDNDLEQLAYNNDNPAWSPQPGAAGFSPYAIAQLGAESYYGRYSLSTVGNNVRLFREQDPRVVLNVVAGNSYIIQVESGQRWVNGALALPPSATDPNNPLRRKARIGRDIETRQATGGYELLVHQIANQISDFENGLPVIDDHSNNSFLQDVDQTGQPAVLYSRQETVISLLDTYAASVNAGPVLLGSISGVINHTPANPTDFDIFRFTAVSNGTYTVRLFRTNAASTLVPFFTSSTPDYSFNGQDPGFDVLNNNPTTTPDGGRQFTFVLTKGQEVVLFLTGANNTEGSYRIDVSGPLAYDDHPDANDWANATTVALPDSSGLATLNGSLNFSGDTDLFRFSITDFDVVTFRVIGLDPTFTPAVTIFEVQESPTFNNPIFLRLGANAASGTAAITLPLMGNRTTGVAPNQRTYPYYYILVQDVQNLGVGRYTLSVQFSATDDHPDADSDKDGAYDLAEFPIASVVAINNSTGQGASTGIIETPNDDDLFRIIAPASGPVTVNLVRSPASTLRVRLTLLNAAGAILAQAVAPDNTTATMLTLSTPALRGESIYISVSGFEDEGVPNANTTRTGTYQLTAQTATPDDHPNRGEFDVATLIALSGITGAGQVGGDAGGATGNPRLEYTGDTDLFTFRVIQDGPQRVILTPFNTALGRFAGFVEVYSSLNTATPIFTAAATAALQQLTITIPAAITGEQFFILIGSDPAISGSTATGEYRIRVEGPVPTEPPPNPDPSSVDFNTPTVIVLNQRTGDGSTLGTVLSPQPAIISPATDRDLYSFTTLANGPVFVRVWTPDGSLLDASVEIFRRESNGSRTSVAFNAEGQPGSTAVARIAARAGETYFILVDGLGDSTGSYVVEVNSEPAVRRLYYPEGYTSDSIFEFIPIANPNPFAVQYTVKLHYETGAETVLPLRTIGANTRDGVTITEGTISRSPGVRPGTPYSLIVEWTIPDVDPVSGLVIDPTTILPLGATLSHYDFGSSTGDAFTERVSDVWSFARVERNPGGVLNYLLFYNPQSFAVDVTATAFLADGRIVQFSQTRRVEGNRREGFGINDFGELGTGVFSVVLRATVAPESNGLVDPQKQAAFEGVVASITSYTLGANPSAFAALGTPGLGQREGVVTNLTQGNGVTSEVTLFNPGTSTASVTLNGSYIRANLPAFARTVEVGPGRVVRLSGSDLGIVNGQPVGLAYTSNNPITFFSLNTQRGDADAPTPAYTAYTQASYGDAFINIDRAGTQYFETLYFYNPGNLINTISIDLLFFDRVDGRGGEASRRSFSITVQPGRFAAVDLHQRSEVLTNRKADGSNPNVIFSVNISGTNPFVSSMTHYDLFLDGGWSAAPITFGLDVPLVSIA